VLVGLGTAGAVLRLVPGGDAVWWAAPALLLGGLGSGCVISPNITMTLRDVPVRMAGAAGGALQTGQRLGGAVGTAALPGLFYMVLGHGGHHYRTALAVAIGSGLVPMLCAWGLAVHDWLRDRRAEKRDPCAPEVSHSHTHAGQN
jgi:MFS family permease